MEVSGTGVQKPLQTTDPSSESTKDQKNKGTSKI